MTKNILPAICLAAALLPSTTEGFSSQLSRRQAFVKAANVAGGVAATVALPNLAQAEVPEETPRVVTRMGGLLVRRSL